MLTYRCCFLTTAIAVLMPVSLWAQSTSPAVFVTNNVGDSVTSFLVQQDGSLSRVGVFLSGDGPQAISLTPDGRFLAVANGTASVTTEELRIFEVNSDATLSLRLTTLVPNSPLDVQWLNDAVLTVSDTTFGSTNFVQSFQYDDVGNTLTLVDSEFTGSFHTRLATTRGGRLLYANNAAGTDSIYAIEASPGGQLSVIENEVTDPLFAIDVAATNDGEYLYGAGGISGSSDLILGYSIAPDGRLDSLPNGPFTSPGDSPKVIDFTDDDRVMVAGHGGDATFWTFTRDLATGDVTSTGQMFDVGLQGTLGDLQIMGDLLFVTDESTAIDGIAGIYSFRLMPDGSFSQLGPIEETLGARPEYIATWVGVPEPVSPIVGWMVLVVICRCRRRVR